MGETRAPSPPYPLSLIKKENDEERNVARTFGARKDPLLLASLVEGDHSSSGVDVESNEKVSSR